MPATDTPFLGLRGTSDWGDSVRPESFREMILYLYPNGDAPLTAVLSMAESEIVTDPHYHWWTQNLPRQGGAPTAVYTNSALSSAYSSGGVTGQVLFIKVTQAIAKNFRAGHTVTLRVSSADDAADVQAEVTQVNLAGDSSYIAVELLEADDNGASLTPAVDLSDLDTILVSGNCNAEGGERPTAIDYDPTKFDNYTQIFRTPFEITNTQMGTKLRIGDVMTKKKRQALELHSIEMEKAFWWSIPTERTASNGKKKRTTGGILHAIKTHAPGNIYRYDNDSAYAGLSWVNGGTDWLMTKLGALFQYGSDEKLALCGHGALTALARLAIKGGHINLTPDSIGFGMKTQRWETPHGTLHLKRHPLFSHESSTANMVVIIEPKRLKYRYIRGRDTKLIKARVEESDSGLDSQVHEYKTECGLEYHNIETFGILRGVGRDSTIA